jgi:hypothetical protein
MADDITGDELKLLRLSVEFRRDEYRELSENWRHLDTKAQGNIAISGFLLAAVVAFLSKGQSSIGPLERWVVTGAIVSLAATIYLAVVALRVRITVGPPHFGMMQETIEDFLRAEDPVARTARLADLIREELSLWAGCNEETRKVVNHKADRLSWAQTAILIATMIVCLITIFRIFN